MRDRTLWTWHIGAGVVILVFLGLHMAIMHLNATLGIFGAPGAEPVDWANVVAPDEEPVLHGHLRRSCSGPRSTTGSTACGTSCSS